MKNTELSSTEIESTQVIQLSNASGNSATEDISLGERAHKPVIVEEQ